MNLKLLRFVFLILFHGISLFAQGGSFPWAWGNNLFAQLGNGNAGYSNFPVQVLNLADVQAIAGGYAHSLAISSFDCLHNLGDMDGDGQMSAYDASLVLQALVGLISLTPEQECLGDIDGGGQISSYDASLILQCIVGICTGLPPNFLNVCQAQDHCF